MKSGIYARWLLRLLGLLLALGGATGMWRGWDIVQVERGWSLFIGGAAALSGGAVVLALAEVVSRLDRLLAASAPVSPVSANRERALNVPQSPEPAAARPSSPPPPEAPSAWPEPIAMSEPAPGETAAAPPPPLVSAASLRSVRAEAAGFKARLKPPAAAPPPLPEGVREIERYQSGGLTYVMLSDGSVELRSEAGAQRFSSIEELRTVLATQA